jgi:hypothetical protein
LSLASLGKNAHSHVSSASAPSIGDGIQERRISALSIGSRARCRFVRGGVHSVYRQACNIELDDGTLVTLLAPETGNAPHGIRCALPEPADFQAWLYPGLAVAADGVLLRIPQAAVAVDFSGATRWRCGVRTCAIDPYLGSTLRALCSVRWLVRELAPRSGFEPLLLDTAAPGSPLECAMQRRLRHALPALAEASSSLDCVATAQALGQLAGLGPGLTPSGDDFIVGYLAALHSRCSCEPLLRSFLDELTAPLTELAAAANPISRQFLLDALEGDFSESLERLVLAVRADDEPRLRESVARLVRTGHSSGTDSLLGVLFGLRPSLVLEDVPPASRRRSSHIG